MDKTLRNVLIFAILFAVLAPAYYFLFHIPEQQRMKAEKYDTCKSTVEFNYKLAWLDECKKIAREVDAGRERCLKAAYVVHGRSQGEFYCMKKFPKASDEGFCSLPKTVATRLNNLNEGALRECFVETENNL